MSAAIGALRVVHHHPGRLRVRARSLERDASRTRAAVEAMRRRKDVAGVRAQDLTGSILVEYDPERVDGGALLEALANALQLSVEVTPARKSVARAITDAARAADERVSVLTRGRLNLRSGVPVAMGIGSVASLLWARDRRAPRWDNLLYWAFACFMALNHEPERRDKGGAGR